ncbi:hypothetical protein KY308_00925 [Candidatus Woesearchaeota archaeon]|nr:hypothetical protein [Candidatus Woesearchaeota archaeon]
MSAIPWILISVAVLLALFLVVFIFLRRKKKRPVDYFNLFLIGIIWLPMGVVFDNYFFTLVGVIFMAIGLVNYKKWKKNHLRYKDLTKEEQKLRMIILIILGILVVAGLVLFLIMGLRTVS